MSSMNILTPQEKNELINIIVSFNAYYYTDNINVDQRYGQAFYNMFADEIFQMKPYPELFYCEDIARASVMIEEAIVDWLVSLRGEESTILCAGCGKKIPYDSKVFDGDSLCEECETAINGDITSWADKPGDETDDKEKEA